MQQALLTECKIDKMFIIEFEGISFKRISNFQLHEWQQISDRKY